jgi:hypothetical protein
MEALDYFPLPESEYDPQKFMRDFLLMDAGLGSVEAEIEYAKRTGNATKMAIAISEGKRMITYMLQYVASAYYSSSGRIKLSPVFKNYDLSFPYKPSELWHIITGEKAPRHEDEEPEIETPDSIARAITLTIEQTEI